MIDAPVSGPADPRPSDPLPTEAPAPPAFDRRVFATIALATLVATFVGMPYGEFLIAQGPALKRLGDPFTRLVVLELLTVLGTWPLAAIGLKLGARMGLGAPMLAAWLRGRPIGARARHGLLVATLSGLAFGAALLLLFAVFKTPMAAEMARLGPTSVPPPAWMGVLGSLAAGVNEETVLRLFLMTTIAAFAWRLVPRTTALWIANGIAALVFGALHFGNVFALGLNFSPFLVAFILLVNGGIGLLCGRLYWTYGIEAAMAAHVACDLVLHGLGPALGATA